MPITADGALTNTIIVGKNQRKPIYKFTNAQLAMGSIKGTFNSNIISNELPIDNFSFTVNYDDEGNQVYLTSDTNQAYVCAGSVPGILKTCGFASGRQGLITDSTIQFPSQYSVYNTVYFMNRGQSLKQGDVLRIGLEVQALDSQNTYMFFDTYSYRLTFNSQNGLFTGHSYGATGHSVGKDILTFTFLDDAQSLQFYVENLSDHTQSGATILVTGIEFNGEMIYGSLYGEYDQPPALYILSNRDKTPASEYLRDIKYGTPVWWYCNHNFMAKGYYKGNTRTSRTTWKLDVMSAIGKLDEKIHVGGIYTGQPLHTFESVLTEICGNTCRFEFDEGDEALANLPIFGWLPYDTARNNLHRLLFAMGASIKKVNVT